MDGKRFSVGSNESWNTEQSLIKIQHTTGVLCLWISYLHPKQAIALKWTCRFSCWACYCVKGSLVSKVLGHLGCKTWVSQNLVSKEMFLGTLGEGMAWECYYLEKELFPVVLIAQAWPHRENQKMNVKKIVCFPRWGKKKVSSINAEQKLFIKKIYISPLTASKIMLEAQWEKLV